MLNTHFKSIILEVLTLFSVGLALASLGADARPILKALTAIANAADNFLSRSISTEAIESFASASNLSSVGSRPTGAFGTTYELSAGELFVWQSKSPHNQADAEAVVIITHGVDRNANDYFSTINSAFQTANSAGLAKAPTNTLRVAPLFFDISADSDALNSSTLAWGASNAWCAGEGSVYPVGSDLSTLAVYDELISKFSNRSVFPKVKQITLVGHGCGAIITQRYAALGKEPTSDVSVRYVIGNPSTMLYFTTDRPEASDISSCPTYNDYYFGLDNFYIPYKQPTSAARQFKTYASRDVRYLVGLADTGGGDQSCEAQAAGGTARKNRTLAYWKYINLLSGGSSSDYSDYPGTFPYLSQSRAGFTATVAHKLYKISGVGHNAPVIINSDEARQAIFGT